MREILYSNPAQVAERPTGKAMEIHEAANIFPIDDEHISDLAADIKKNGQKVAIELFEGKIIDGRRRFKACQVAGIEPLTKNVLPEDPISYVLSLNLHRRHLNPSQLAMVGARAREIYDREAKERQKASLKKGAAVPVPANLPEREKSDSRDAVGKAIGVSGKTIDHATRVLNQAVPEVVKAVDEGRMAVSTAAILAAEPEDKQREEISNPKRNRVYKPGCLSGDAPSPGKTSEPEPQAGKVRGVGVEIANEAINCLIRIPKNDALRKRGLQIVADWIKANR